MKKLVAALVVLAATLTVAGVSSAGPLKFGAADDTGKYANDCGLSFYGQMNDIGYTVDRISVLWDESRPNDIVEQGFLDSTIPCAQAKGITIVFDTFPLHPTGISANPVQNTAQFTSWLQTLARRYPTVTNIIVGNEPNVNRFWQPVASGPAQFEALLAQSYDALKAVNPSINVIGVGLSPRGNDNPDAPSNPSYSPVKFISLFAKAYRDSGRTKPLMDEFSFHPYANQNNDPYSKGYQWPNAGGANFDRVKQAFWDGFHGTAQKIFAEQSGGRLTQGGAADASCDTPATSAVLCMNLDEAGTQTTTAGHAGYTGAESPNLVPQLVDEATQARYYTELIDIAACDPSIESLLLFDFIDETPLDRFQSGEVFADGAKKQSYGAIQSKIRSEGGRCTKQQDAWRHATEVIGAKTLSRTPAIVPATNQYWAFSASATEDASYQAWIANGAGKKVATANGVIQAYYTPLVKFPAKKLAAGCYSYGITLSAVVNPSRDTTLTADKFKVGAGAGCSAAKPKKK
jgi:predicted small lipoprotein YifL